jgi:hypothetical protein
MPLCSWLQPGTRVVLSICRAQRQWCNNCSVTSSHWYRRGAQLALAGALALPSGMAVLTALQWEFMTGLGWHALRAPTFDWPSGLALGPYGAWMTGLFIACGGALMALALTLREWLLRRGLRRSTAIAMAFGCTGLGMAGLAFSTDPTLTTVTPTWHGRLHDLSFGLLGASLALGLLLCAATTWRAHRLASLATLGVVLVTAAGFIVKGLLFYVMFVAVFGWIAASAWFMLRDS